MRHILRKLSPLHLWLPLLAVLALCHPTLQAQQTLGGITGEVTDASGGVIPDAAISLVGEQTALSRSAKTNGSGNYQFVNLPIGTYTLTYTANGYEGQKITHLIVQANRTSTANAMLKVGQASAETIEVEASPLMNTVDTTNGYVLDKAQIELAPLATGSFTGLAIQSTGVSAELSGGTGVNSGLGNAPIWANGQRDTSNTFLLNGVDATNLFNGKSTSQVGSSRVVLNTGATFGAGGVVQTSASVYLAVGNAIPSPAPEMIEEVRVNASMYDAQQGSTSGAHLDMSTKSGTNDLHGNAYIHRGTNWINAAPFFFKNDPDIPESQKVPQLHRYTAGLSVGAPIIKDKLFFYAGYQHLHVSDQETGYSRFSVPVGLGDDRSPDALAALSNAGWCPNDDTSSSSYYCTTGTKLTGSQLDNENVNPGSTVAYKMMTHASLKGESGSWLVPNDQLGSAPTASHPYNVSLPGTAYFIADQAVANLDWNASKSDTLAVKYFYQHDPTTAPFAYSQIPGFTQHLDNGSQVFSINNVNIIKSNLSVTETVGVIREKTYSNNEQPFSASDLGVNNLGSNYYAGVTIVDILGKNTPVSQQALNIGPGTNQGSLTGVFQNRLMPSGSAIWTLGKHTLAFGGSWAYTQLNMRDNRPGVAGTTSSADFSQFIQGLVTTNDLDSTTTFMQGDANRYMRAIQSGAYFQDKYQILPNLSITAGIRWDLNGGFSEKNGRIYNFNSSLYDEGTAGDSGNASGELTNNGFVIAKDAHDTTLAGRQWGIAPRIGLAWSPERFGSKVVVRSGVGFYYDRGELFSYFSPGYAAGEITGGPFGVSQSPPFVNQQHCTPSSNYNGYIPTCDQKDANLAMPWGSSLGAAPTGKASDIGNYLPNAYAILNGAEPLSIGIYDRKNTLPYSINYTLDTQWQLRPDLAIEIGYVGNVGRHQVVPTPFNQSHIATPNSPIRGQKYSYGYTLTSDSGDVYINDDAALGTYMANFEGGNVDLRVPYIGYSSESIDYKAAGISMYNAAQIHIDKRMSHGIQAGVSYTFSHTTDEQSALGLFYNGDNPTNLRTGYGLADFDRKHDLNFTFSYQIPSLHLASKVAKLASEGWTLNGITVLQSGQPFSIIDYSGAVGSIYYSTYDGINNPIVPLAAGCTPKNATTGASGAFGNPALKSECFTVPVLSPDGTNGVPTNDPFETTFIEKGQRNIFRQAPQRRADLSLVKVTPINEHIKMRYTLDVFNVSNTTSFDITGDDVTQNEEFNNYPNISEVNHAIPSSCSASGTTSDTTAFYNCPAGLGITTHTIGSPRQVQMSLRFDF